MLRGAIVVAGIIVIACLPGLVLAQAPIVSCGTNCTLVDLLELPVRIFNYMMSLVVAVVFAVIVFAGVRMTVAYLNEAPDSEVAAAKATLRNGLVGFAIVVTVIVLVNTLLLILGLRQGAVANILCTYGIGC
jgi:hypothetical protein